MTKTDWEKVKEQVLRPCGHADLIADGYTITLQLQMLTCRMKNAIRIWINGQFKGAWLNEDCEERRRFFPQKKVSILSLMTKKEIAAFNQLPKYRREELHEYRDRTIPQYESHWTNWAAMVKHLEANNSDIHIPDAED